MNYAPRRSSTTAPRTLDSPIAGTSLIAAFSGRASGSV